MRELTAENLKAMQQARAEAAPRVLCETARVRIEVDPRQFIVTHGPNQRFFTSLHGVGRYLAHQALFDAAETEWASRLTEQLDQIAREWIPLGSRAAKPSEWFSAGSKPSESQNAVAGQGGR